MSIFCLPMYITSKLVYFLYRSCNNKSNRFFSTTHVSNLNEYIYFVQCYTSCVMLSKVMLQCCHYFHEDSYFIFARNIFIKCIDNVLILSSVNYKTFFLHFYSHSPQFFPNPQDGSLYRYTLGRGRDPLKKLPFTIPQLVANSPCRSSDGIFYLGMLLPEVSNVREKA